jgi:putative nucleotidyltransferase with HDIG domain
MIPASVSVPVPASKALDDDHCRRVGGIANLVAHHLFLSTEQKQVLHSACLLHHHKVGTIEGQPENASKEVLAVLDSFARVGQGEQMERKLAAILRLCDTFDGEFREQVSDEDTAELLTMLRNGVGHGLWPRQVLDALQECARPVKIPPPAEWHVPVFPQAAIRTLEAMRQPSVSIPQVVDAARRDPATAGALMQLANSTLFSDMGSVSTLQIAVSRLGFEVACKVVASLAMRPLLHIPRLEALWPHSVVVADLAEQLAVRARGIDPGEAYLAGLLHDVGRIALRTTTLYDAARVQGLEQSGCPAVYAENLILRTNHAELGARIAEIWKLPEPLLSAIAHHHRPERSSTVLACLLYLAEYMSGSKEDLASRPRLDLSLSRLGLRHADLGGCTRSQVGTWLAAA